MELHESLTKMPFNLELEAAFLGALLRNNEAWPHVAGKVSEDDFYAPEHRDIFSQASARLGRGEDANAATLSISEALRKYCLELVANVVTVVRIADYARDIRDKAEKRRIMEAAEVAIERCQEDDFDDPAGKIGADLSQAVTRETRMRKVSSVKSIADRITDGLKKPLPCTSTGIDRLDHVLAGGLYAKRLYGFGARPKGGKSMILKTLAYNVAKQGKGVVYITLEDDEESPTEMLLAREMGINAMAFKNLKNRQDPEFVRNVSEAGRKFEDLPLWFIEEPRMSLSHLGSTLAIQAMRPEVDGIIVDYLQLVSGAQKGKTQAEHFDDVSQAMAEAGKKYGKWIATAVQINRTGEVRGGDGLLMGCDVAMVMHKVENTYAPSQPHLWLEMIAGRYTPMQDVGSEEGPALMIHKIGPHIDEVRL